MKAKLFERRGNVTIIDRRGPASDFTGVCEDCGNTDELRPYGPGYTNVCYDCMLKDEPGARRRMHELMEQQ